MSSLLGLSLFGLIFPFLWGLIVYRIMEAFWPKKWRRPLVSPDGGSDESVPDLLDYQI
jgi:hypothetical protein